MSEFRQHLWNPACECYSGCECCCWCEDLNPRSAEQIDAAEKWQPGDPVYPREPASGACPHCGCTWYPGDLTVCPDCAEPMA